MYPGMLGLNTYSEIVMHNLPGHPGTETGGDNLNNPRYAEETLKS